MDSLSKTAFDTATELNQANAQQFCEQEREFPVLSTTSISMIEERVNVDVENIMTDMDNREKIAQQMALAKQKGERIL